MQAGCIEAVVVTSTTVCLTSTGAAPMFNPAIRDVLISLGTPFPDRHAKQVHRRTRDCETN